MVILKNLDALFAGSFMVVSKNEKQIDNQATGEVVKYYEVALSNGKKVVELTCGEKSDLLKAKLFQLYDMEFSVEKKGNLNKLKVVQVNGLDTAGSSK